MARSNGTGAPMGSGPGTGRGTGRGGPRPGRLYGIRAGAGLEGKCVCPECGRTAAHVVGTPCFVMKCPQCGSSYFPNHQPAVIPQFIRAQKANVMIAGGMGPRAIGLFSQLGIAVATGVQGKVRDVVDAYLRGEVQGIVACEHHGQDHECEEKRL